MKGDSTALLGRHRTHRSHVHNISRTQEWEGGRIYATRPKQNVYEEIFCVKKAGGLFIIGISTQSPPAPNNGNEDAFVIMLRSNCLN